MKQKCPLSVFRAIVMWILLLSAPSLTLAADQGAYVPGTTLLKTNWSQKYPFNKFLPKLSGERVVAGCVNVALAQLMYYYKYPLSSEGILNHNWRGRLLSASLGHSYNWKDIPDEISSLSPVYRIDEIASLIRELGIMNETQFNTASEGGSGASIQYDKIIKHFKYSTSIKNVSNDDPGFFDIITNEINRRRPVLLEIQGEPMGHMAVIDGFRNSPNGKLFHLNMGWGGRENGFYDLRRTIQLKSAEEENFFASDYRFSNKLRIFHNFVPCQRNDCYVNLENGDQANGRQIRGRFDGPKDKDCYRGLYLRNRTIISGERGFANMGFYINIYDSQGRMVVSASPKSKAFEVELEAGKYDVEASQCVVKNGQSACFKPSPKFAKYEIDINSAEVDRDMKNLIDEIDDETFIRNRFSDLILDYGAERKIRIDAYNPAGKAVDIKAESDDKSILKTMLEGNQLILTPVDPERNSMTKVTVTASSGKRSTAKEFYVLFNPGSISFGKEFEVNGEFTSQTSVSRRKVILDGVCKISGNNGYKNQAFFIEVKNINGVSEVSPSERTIAKNFKRGLYYIESTLQKRKVIKKGNSKNVRINSFKYRKDFGNIYNVNIVCPNFREDIALLKYDNRDLPPTIVSELPDRIVGHDFTRLEIPIKTNDNDGEEAELDLYIDHDTLDGKIVDGVLVLSADRIERNSSAQISVTAKSNNYESKKSFRIFFASEDFPFGEAFEVKGRFKDQGDATLFKVVLSGSCSISGHNGYTNQAFYIQMLNHRREPFLQITDKPFKHVFPTGIYYVRASLKGNLRSYYRFIPEKSDKHKISFLCPSMKNINDDIERALSKD